MAFGSTSSEVFDQLPSYDLEVIAQKAQASIQLVKSTLKNKFAISGLLRGHEQPTMEELIENLDFSKPEKEENDASTGENRSCLEQGVSDPAKD